MRKFVMSQGHREHSVAVAALWLASAVIRLSREVNDEAAVERYLAPMSNEVPAMNPSLSPASRRYVRRWQLNGGTYVTIRPIQPEDQNKMMAFHQTLSLESVYLRYAGILDCRSVSRTIGSLGFASLPTAGKWHWWRRRMEPKR